MNENQKLNRPHRSIQGTSSHTSMSRKQDQESNVTTQAERVRPTVRGRFDEYAPQQAEDITHGWWWYLPNKGYNGQAPEWEVVQVTEHGVNFHGGRCPRVAQALELGVFGHRLSEPLRPGVASQRVVNGARMIRTGMGDSVTLADIEWAIRTQGATLEEVRTAAAEQLLLGGTLNREEGQ